jgi:4'-phosphopantetheinyl transferase
LDGPGDIRFNLAHSGSLAVYGFARGCEIGIDVEECRPLRDLESIARNCFSESETSHLLCLDVAEDRLQAFYRCWTRKEAYVKAVGEGLFYPLQRFEVTVSDADCTTSRAT